MCTCYGGWGWWWWGHKLIERALRDWGAVAQGSIGMLVIVCRVRKAGHTISLLPFEALSQSTITVLGENKFVQQILKSHPSFPRIVQSCSSLESALDWLRQEGSLFLRSELCWQLADLCNHCSIWKALQACWGCQVPGEVLLGCSSSLNSVQCRERVSNRAVCYRKSCSPIESAVCLWEKEGVGGWNQTNRKTQTAEGCA